MELVAPVVDWSESARRQMVVDASEASAASYRPPLRESVY